MALRRSTRVASSKYCAVTTLKRKTRTSIAIYFVHAAIFASLLLPPALNAGGALRPFEVRDGITMIRINTGTTAIDDPIAPNPFHPSPDGTMTLAVIRQGNLQTGENEYDLILFRNKQVARFVNDPEKSRKLRVPFEKLAHFSTAATNYGIDGVQWLPDSSRVLFIGRDSNRIGQIFVADPYTGDLQQLTRHQYDIGAFAISADGRKLVFSAHAPPQDWTDVNAHGYVVTSKDIAERTYLPESRQAWNCCRQYVFDLQTRQVVAVDTPPALHPPDVWLSPRGRYAVTRGTLQGGYPGEWKEYEFMQAQGAAGNGWDDGSILVQQFFLIDMTTGNTRVLIDAPIPDTADSTSVSWSDDESSVILGPTYLPIDQATTAAERTRRSRSSSVVEVDITTGASRRVLDVQGPDGVVKNGFVDLAAIRRTGPECVAIESHVRQRWDQLPGPPSVYHTCRSGFQWHPAEGQRGSLDRQGRKRLEFFLHEDLNTPPEIAARDPQTSRERVLTALNPQFRELTLGRVKRFEWRDRLQRVHSGALIYPPRFQPGKRYPLVIQTYGFKDKAFLIEGPPLAAKGVFAAQALANKDILVLQMPREEMSAADAAIAGSYEDAGETPRFIAMLESAVDALDSLGVIDRQRIGLTGFSRSAVQSISALTFARYPIAAATLGDGAPISPFTYVLNYGTGNWMSSSELEMGGPPWGRSLEGWLARSPSYHYDRIQTPLRLEKYGDRWVDYRWDMYVMLKRSRHPIELIYFHDGSHVLVPPYAVYASQQGTVDWYAFWLKDEEDRDERKREQYERWRELRTQRDALLAKPRPPVIKWKAFQSDDAISDADALR